MLMLPLNSMRSEAVEVPLNSKRSEAVDVDLAFEFEAQRGR
jgi:hypothetical protein